MKPTLALLAVFSVACGGSSGASSGLPTAPTAVALPPAHVEGGQLFTYLNAVAIGALDEQYRRENITAVFEAGRAAGAPWVLSIDPFQHGPMVDFDRMFDWIDAALAARVR